MTPRKLYYLMPLMLLLSSTLTHAADRWVNQTINSTLVAITPAHQLQVFMVERPTETIWAKINIPVNEDQLPELHKHRKSPNFPFIEVGVDVDGYYRTAQGHIHDEQNLITVEIDQRHWDGLKKGNKLILSLPDGTELGESLRGSGAVLRSIERR